MTRHGTFETGLKQDTESRDKAKTERHKNYILQQAYVSKTGHACLQSILRHDTIYDNYIFTVRSKKLIQSA